MQTYIALVKLTDKGRVEIAESLKRGEYAQEIMERNVSRCASTTSPSARTTSS